MAQEERLVTGGVSCGFCLEAELRAWPSRSTLAFLEDRVEEDAKGNQAREADDHTGGDGPEASIFRFERG